MKNDLKSSAIGKVNELSHTLKFVNEDVVKITNYKQSVETKIIDFCEIYSIENEELSSISVQNVPIQTKIPLKSLLDVFSNADVRVILENVVAEIEIDLPQTAENLRFSGNFQEPIIKNILKQLNKLSNTTVKKVEFK